MTIKALHKILSKMISDGHGRKPVTVSKTTFTHPCEADGQTILDVYHATLRVIEMGDDDGGWKWRKDGTLSMHTMLVLEGIDGAKEDSK